VEIRSGKKLTFSPKCTRSFEKWCWIWCNGGYTRTRPKWTCKMPLNLLCVSVCLYLSCLCFTTRCPTRLRPLTRSLSFSLSLSLSLSRSPSYWVSVTFAQVVSRFALNANESLWPFTFPLAYKLHWHLH
jgi:hypothetical protein